eukprot:CAMPEP_0197584334 /NCGR_PEP_ID=MMETSP1326-20131121/6995_1 /TAXON_ID=1155430 /ORGANISM="Genus nov. species nov., Strain RCC2288" /LENGTH=35 /DNA_ID= /DNA_START= /DNA_END= /DNA_ORIENTATION=
MAKAMASARNTRAPIASGLANALDTEAASIVDSPP